MMVNSPVPQNERLLRIGRTLPRERYQRGHLVKTGETRKKWTGHWFEYRPNEQGEKRVHREKVLGLCSELTKGQAQEALDRLIREATTVAAAGPKQMGELTVAEMGDRYRGMNGPSWSSHWRTVMKSLFVKHINPVLGKMKVRDVRREVLQLHLNKLFNAGVGSSITQKVRTHLKAMFDEAMESDLIPKNPARKLSLPKYEKKTKRYLTLQECQSLLRVSGEQDYLIIWLAVGLGMRPSEIFALRADDIQPGALRIDEAIVQGKVGEPKTLRSKGSVLLTPDMESRFQFYSAQHKYKGRDFLFPSRTGKPLRQGNYVRRQLKTLAKLAGVGKADFQMMRRTFATWMQSHGTVKDIQGALRHARPDLTANTYMQEIPANTQKAVCSWEQELLRHPSPRGPVN